MKNKQSIFKAFMQVVKVLYRLLIMIIKIIPMIFNALHKWLVKRLRFSITFKITTVYATIFTIILLLFNIGICAAVAAYLGVNAAENMGKDYQIIASYFRERAAIPTTNIDELAKIKNIDITIFAESKEALYTTKKDEASLVFYDKNSGGHVINPYKDYFLVINKNPAYYNPNIFYNNVTNDRFFLVLNESMNWRSDNIYVQITDNLSRETHILSILVTALFSITVAVIIVVVLIGSNTSKKCFNRWIR
ncbi:hypothetical protein N752_21155 [Desulforamulus aquiferis]|nr:hypothetical protein [Desulforamulus aquiferis]RYD03343.1 hypothetical protein N752_21155 [Desulforamulus aquiferis]